MKHMITAPWPLIAHRLILTGLLGLLGLLGLSVSACQELLLSPPDSLKIPETLRVPPVGKKQLVLQAALDGVLDSIRVDERACETEEVSNQLVVRCQYPDGSQIELQGELSTESRSRSVLGRESNLNHLEGKLTSIKIRDYKFLAHAGPQHISGPQTCRREAIINGDGTFFGALQTTSLGERRILLNAGGIYQGRFQIEYENEAYDVELPLPGFYHRRDLTPLLITAPDQELNEPPRLQLLQVGIISSGRVKINEQRYSFQDVFLETFSTEEFWDVQCDSPMTPSMRDR